MNTKTSYKYGHNFYDGSNHAVGRDSPGALLDMLAEVASRTLHSESSRYVSDASDDLSTSRKQNTEQVRRKTQEVNVNLPQLLSMPSAQLVKHFAVFTSDELKRQYSYVCALVPGCEKKYTSFASEGKARVSIKAHLVGHLEDLKNNADSYNSFTVCAGKNGKQKVGSQVKKYRAQLKKPAETPNKENKEEKSEKPTNYLRKILSNEMNFNEFERQKRFQTEDTESDTKYINFDASGIVTNKTNTDGLEFKVLGDHSYYEHLKEEKTTNETRDEMVNEAMSENIMLMVVESDGVHVKELPYVSDDVAGQSNADSNSDFIGDSKIWVDEIRERSTETTAASKPKGKAKFIGTSKEEREMALILIERIKKKGNPTGSNLQCRICDPPRSFTAPTTLVSHYRSHAGIKPYECRICRSVFTRRHSLKYHMLIHQNQTRFTCADCGKKFRHPSHFREHRRRHTGESPFGCDDCGQRFKTRNTYKRHLKTRHGKVLTTTGELLCLTEEEFEKVQTNRKRKTQNSTSIWCDLGREEDAKASESIANDDNETSNVEENVNNNEATIVDYNTDERTTYDDKNVDENLTTVVKTEEIIENDEKMNDFQREMSNFHENSIELMNNSQEKVEIVCQNGETIDIPFCIDDNFADNKICQEISSIDENSCGKNCQREINNENRHFCCDNYCKSVKNCEENQYESSNNFCEIPERIDQHFCESSNVRYAYKINGNVSYQFHVLPRENVELNDSQICEDNNSRIYEENSQIFEENSRISVNNTEIYDENNSRIFETKNSRINDENVEVKNIEYRSIIDNYSLSNNNNSPDEKFDEIAENSGENSTKNNAEMENTRGAISVVSGTKNGTFIFLSNENFKGNYLRIETGNNIVVKKGTALSAIALPQK